MKYYPIAILALCISFSPLQAINNCFICYSQANGDSITLWNDYDISGFRIYASVQVDGVWGPSVPITPYTNSQQQPKASINEHGEAIVVWKANDAVTNNPTLYGVTYNSSTSTWSSTPATISDSINEQVLDDFCIKIADDHSVVVTWSSYLPPSTYTMRGSWSAALGTWGTPTNIPPPPPIP